MSEKLQDLWIYITGPNLWIAIGQSVLKIIVIIILASIVVRVGKNIIDRVFSKKQGPIRISERREETIQKLMKNVLSYVVYFIAFIMVLEALSLPITSLLAGAGVAGLAIGFGAQNLVRDIISGFFIVFEDQFSVGDYVIVAGAEGTVEEIGLRTTKIQSWTGEQNVIPNGNITQVINYSIHNGLAIVDINVPYENDIAAAEAIIEDVVKRLPDKYEEIVNTPVIHGIQALETSHYVIRVIADTLPVYQWFGARVIRKEVKERLYKEGIDIPAPRLVMYSRNEQPTALEIDNNRKERETGNGR
ncbi:mechanosensitive ion channel family protein [Virgibacillus sp. W0430]|uniref:mechanosensitive ion channel family protein n=1 Tax=Virgibacillus sp. W0430 TaxID=3391580 RepID=UPI003F474D0A